jgi:hypothetical protein
MAQPRYDVLFGGELLDSFESRADAEHFIERDIQVRTAGLYAIDDSEFRAEEQVELDAQYAARELEAAQAKLAEHEEKQAELAQAAAVVNQSNSKVRGR